MLDVTMPLADHKAESLTVGRARLCVGAVIGGLSKEARDGYSRITPISTKRKSAGKLASIISRNEGFLTGNRRRGGDLTKGSGGSRPIPLSSDMSCLRRCGLCIYADIMDLICTRGGAALICIATLPLDFGLMRFWE